MSLLSILETILIGPLKLVFEMVFTLSYQLTGNPGLSIVFLSLVMNLLVLPLYKRADAMQERARDVEAKLSAGGSLELTAKASPAQAEAVLSSLAGVKSQTLLGQTEDTARFSITTDGDIREPLFYAFAESHLPLLELRPRKASLEEVFLDLTDEDDAVAAQAAALFQTPEREEAVHDDGRL